MNEPTKPKRRWRLIGALLLAVVLLHLLGDAIYSAYVAAAIDAWTDGLEVEDNGVLAGCDAYDLPPATEGDTRSAVLLVHGFNASPRHWDFVAPALAERGLHCRVTRLAGFAEPFALTAEKDADLWVAIVKEELERLRSRYDRVGVVGHSLGGAATIRALIDDPEAADYAVLVAPAVAVSDARAPLLSTRTWHEVSKRTLLFTRVVKSPYPMDCHVPGRTDWPGRLPFSSRDVVDAVFTLLDRNLPQAERFATPVTVFTSRDDVVVDTPATHAYFERLGSDDKTLVRLTESGHAIPLDSEWERVVEAVVTQEAAAPEPRDEAAEPQAESAR